MAAKKSTTKTTTVDTATENVAVDASLNNTDETTKAKTTKAKSVKKEDTVVTAKVEKEDNTPLSNTDEIEVIALIPHVSYKDNKTGDFYEWDEIGHVEYMTVETLKDMWRSYKKYFRSMWLKPNDKRIINQFGLTKTYENYEYLMNKDSYTKENISDIVDKINTIPNSVKFTICNMVRNQVAQGNISDGKVIKALETSLNMDLFSSL